MSFDADEEVAVSTTERPAWLQPYSEELVQRGQSLSSEPWTYMPAGAERIAPLSNEELAGIDIGTQRALVGHPAMAAAGQGLSQLIGPDAAFSPLTNRLVQASQDNLVDQFNLNVAPATAAQFNRANTFGSTGQQELEAAQRFSLARAMEESEAGIRNQALNRSLSAINMAPQIANQDYVDMNALMSLGERKRGLGQAIRDADLERFMDIRNDPLRRLEVLGSVINTGGGGYSTVRQTQPGSNQWLDLLGAGGSFAGGLGSLLGSLP